MLENLPINPKKESGSYQETRETEKEKKKEPTVNELLYELGAIDRAIVDAELQGEYFTDRETLLNIVKGLRKNIVNAQEILAIAEVLGKKYKLSGSNEDELEWSKIPAYFKVLERKAGALIEIILADLPDRTEPTQSSAPSYDEGDSVFKNLKPTSGGGGVNGGGGSGGGSIDNNGEHHFENHEYPNMGKFDITKRFLLAPEIGGEWWDYEKVKEWGYAEIIQAIFLYIEMFLSRDWHLDRPFIAQKLLDKHASITPKGQDSRNITLEAAISELGGDITQVILDRIKALEALTEKATAHQSIRILGRNAEEIVETVSLSNSIIEGLFDTHAFGPEGELVEFRARGMPVTNAVLLRFIFASMYNRGLNEDSDERKEKPSPFEQEGGKRFRYVKSFEQISEAMFNLLKYIGDKHNNTAGFVEDPDKERYLEGIPYSEDWAHGGEEFVNDEVLKRLVNAAVAKAVNLGDVLLLRAIHDLGASRHDELEISRLLRYRASQIKYYLYNQETGKYERIKGSVEISDIGIISFWESLYKPPIQRIRMRPISVKVDEEAYQEALSSWNKAKSGKEPEKKDFIVISSEEKQWHNAMTDWSIPNYSKLSKDQLEKAESLLEKTEKIKDNLFLIEKGLLDSAKKPTLEAELVDLSRKITLLLEEAGLLSEVLANGELVITSLYDLIKKYHEKSADDEMKKINHVGPVRKALSDFPFNLSELVVKKEREFSDGEIVTFNPQLAKSLSSVLRSAFYYWIQDYNKKSLSAREYDEMVRNYPEPRKNDYIDQDKYEKDLESWKDSKKHKPAIAKYFKYKDYLKDLESWKGSSKQPKPRKNDYIYQFVYKKDLEIWKDRKKHKPAIAKYFKYKDYLKDLESWKDSKKQPKPRKNDYIDQNKYEKDLDEWQRKWAWRGVPLRMFKRVSPEDSRELLDDDGNPILIYVEYDINHLFNLHIDYDKLVRQKRMSRQEARWHQQDFARIIGAKDQLDAMMKICTEKLVMMKIKEFIKSGNKWTGDHTRALVQLMSNSAFNEDREGLRSLILRQKSGAFGIWEGADETYSGAGGWTRKEVLNMIKATVGNFKSFGVDFSDDKK